MKKIDYWAKPNSSCLAGKKIGEEIIFENIECSYDSYGFRKCPPAPNADKHEIFLGGSFVFGEGLQPADTLPCKFKELTGGKYRAFNLAKRGFSIGEMYILLKDIDLKEVFKLEYGVMIYGFLGIHIDRVTGDFSTPLRSGYFKRNFLFRTNSENDPPFEAFQMRDSTLLANAFGILSELRKFSPLTRRLTEIPMPLASRAESIELTIELISEVKKIYESNLKGTFYVLIWPRAQLEEQDYFNAQLKKRNINVIRPKGLPSSSNLPSTLHPLDRHPSKYEDEAIAIKLVKELGVSR